MEPMKPIKVLYLVMMIKDIYLEMGLIHEDMDINIFNKINTSDNK